MTSPLLAWRAAVVDHAKVAGRVRHRVWLDAVVFGVLYGIAARLGLAYSSVAPNVTLIWAPTGISLFVFLRRGPRLWPGIVLGDLIANAGTGASWLAIAGISAGNLVQTWGGWWALTRTGFDARLERVRDVFALLGLGTAAAAASALVGPTALWLDGRVPDGAWQSVGLQWWMGDAAGVVVLTPWLLAWWRRPWGAPAPRALEAVALLTALALLCDLVFGATVLEAISLRPGVYPAALALFPLVIWGALRFGLRGATLVTLIVTAAAIWGTVRGLGPFVDDERTGSLVRWWVFANVITVTGLLLSASQSERDRARADAIRDRDFGDAILDAEGALVVVLDGDGRIVRANRSFEDATGFASADLVGQRFAEALIPDDQRAKVDGHVELLRVGVSERARVESALRRHRGPPITVSWTTTALRDADGRMTHAIVSGADVSLRVEAAGALRHARRELEARVAERTHALAQANAALQAEMAERLRLEHELIDVSEREQQRIGEELHDGLGQHLTAAAVQAELLARDLETAGAADAMRDAQRIEAMLSDAVAQTRSLARGLYPVEVDRAGLMAALQSLAASTSTTLRRRCTLVCPGPVEVVDHVASVHLYRIAQEAVTNAVRHAPGAAIAVALRVDGDTVVLDVRNAIVAVPDHREREREPGLGARIMRHRAHLIGARLDIGPDRDEWHVRVCWTASAATAETAHA
jgi:PAS domain S-box-containing protein